LSIRQRIYLGFASVIAFIAVFSVVIVHIMSGMYDNTERIGTSLYTKVQYAHDIQITVGRMNEALPNLLLFEDPVESLRTIAAGRETLRSIHRELAGMIETPQGKAYYEEAGRLYASYELETDKYIRLAEAGETEAARAFLVSIIQPKEAELMAALDDFTALQEQLMIEQVADSERQHRIAMTLMWIGIALTALFCGATGIGVVRSTLRSIRSISDVMNGIQELATVSELPRMRFEAADEMGAIVKSYNLMADALESHAKQDAAHHRWLEAQNWVKSNVAGAMNACQGAKTVDVFGERLLSHVVPAIGAAAGALYFADATKAPDRFVRVAAYAFDPTSEVVECAFRHGEGLVGQCAADGAPIMREAPPGYLRIVSGLGHADANYVLLLPIRFEGSVVAVLELGAFAPFEPRAMEFLQELAAGSLGASLQSISYHVRVQALLSDSQTYVEELQTQSEELQQQQEELRSLNEKLAEQFRYSEQRGNELEQIRAELEAKAVELQASSQFKSEFLANISHELRTPLNSLLILAQMLADDAERTMSDKQREYARTILFSGNELLALINDVLDLSKIEAGQMTRSEEPIELGSFAADVARQFRGVAERKGLAFDVDVEPGVAEATLLTDSRMLQQIVNNLLSNAFKFTDAGTIAMRIYEAMPVPSETPAPEGAVWVAFQVRDTGIGIPAEKHELIFEAFRQADGKTTRKYGGTGLGLSISKELSRLLGGTIRLESEEGRGSTFTVTIPMRPSDGARIGAGESLAPSEQPLLHDGGEAAQGAAADAGGNVSFGKILLVDDDIRNVYALTAALLEQRYEVAYAEDGASALAALEEQPDIDLVLMDMMMPGMDGYEATRRIRADARFAKLPVIALTAKAMKEDRDMCLEAGANDYVSKPVKLDKLLSLLRVWLDDSGERNR